MAAPHGNEAGSIWFRKTKSDGPRNRGRESLVALYGLKQAPKAWYDTISQCEWPGVLGPYSAEVFNRLVPIRHDVWGGPTAHMHLHAPILLKHGKCVGPLVRKGHCQRAA